MSASDFEGLSLQKLLEPKSSFQLRHFATLLQISPDWNKLSLTAGNYI